MLTIFEIAALLLSLSALLGWFNLRFLKMPHTIGLLIIPSMFSIIQHVTERASPRRKGQAADLTSDAGPG